MVSCINMPYKCINAQGSIEPLDTQFLEEKSTILGLGPIENVLKHFSRWPTREQSTSLL